MVRVASWSAVAVTLVAAVMATPVQEKQSAITSAPDPNDAYDDSGYKPAPTSASTPSPAQLRALQSALLMAPSEGQRQKILLPNPPDASNITYQFVNITVQPPTGGIIALSEVDQFPALIGTNVAMAIGFVNACGLNVPHSHPRANEFLTVVQGKLIGGLVVEQNPGSNGNTNGQNPTGPQQLVNATLENYKGMLFPQGSTHFQFNPTCKPAVFAAAFDNNDPGRAQIARNFFSVFPDDVILSAVGGDNTLLDAKTIDKLRNKIPSAFAELIESCVKRCHGHKYNEDEMEL